MITRKFENFSPYGIRIRIVVKCNGYHGHNLAEDQDCDCLYTQSCLSNVTTGLQKISPELQTKKSGSHSPS